MCIHDLRHIDAVYSFDVRLGKLPRVGDEEEGDGEFAVAGRREEVG